MENARSIKTPPRIRNLLRLQPNGLAVQGETLGEQKIRYEIPATALLSGFAFIAAQTL
jgi:hypothetical protein